MYKGLSIHSLHCSEFVELTLNTISALADNLILSADSLIVFSNAIKLPTNTIKRDKNKLIPPEIHIVFHRVFHSS